MTFDTSLLSLYEDEITIEPFSSETGARARSYGSGVAYPAILTRGSKRIIGNDGSEVISTVQAMIPERVHIDTRSRVTLPSGFVPSQPPILGLGHYRGQGMDSTEIML